MTRHHGFTMFEMVIVLVMLGILTAGLAPLLLSKYSQATEDTDHRALTDAQTAIINYALSFGGIPDPIDATTGAAVAGVGAMPPSTGTGAVTAFGVNNWGAFGTQNAFRLDVNDKLRSSYINGCNNDGDCTNGAGAATSGDKVVFCQSVNQQLTAAATVPQICQDLTGNHIAPASACASFSPTGFLIYSTGNDRTSNQENNETGGVGANRIYENDKRGINSTAGDDRYDDQVMSYPLTALARDCREKVGVLPEVMSCAPGQKAVVVTNTSGATRYYTGTGNTLATNIACTPPLLNGASSVAVCQDRGATINAFSDAACTAAAGTSAALSTVTNSNGKITAVVNAATVSLF